jgi:hypothetical protein
LLQTFGHLTCGRRHRYSLAALPTQSSQHGSVVAVAIINAHNIDTLLRVNVQERQCDGGAVGITQDDDLCRAAVVARPLLIQRPRPHPQPIWNTVGLDEDEDDTGKG